MNVTGAEAQINVADGRPDQDADPNQSLLEVRSGGQVLVDGMGYAGGRLTVADQFGTNGKLVISGVGSTVTVQNDLDDSLEATEFGAGVTIGHRGDAELYIDQGGKLIVNGADDASPSIWIGRGGGGDNYGDTMITAYAVVTGAGSAIELTGTNTVNSPAVSNGFVGSGSFGVGLRNGAEGELQILDGGRVSVNGPNSGMVIGDDAGAQGLVIVDGASSLLEVDQRISIGMAISSDGTPDAGSTPEDGGVGELRITNGGTVETGTLRVGERSVLDINGGTLETTGDIEIWGRFEVGRDVIGTATLDGGGLEFGIGGTWIFDVDGFGANQADFVTFIGDGDDVNTRVVPIILDLDPTLNVSVGDQVAVVEWTGALTNVTERVIYDQNRGIEFNLEQQGSQLVLVAQEDSGTGLNFVGDGTNEVIQGTPFDDVLDGAGGNDIIEGLAGDDILLGGPGDDALMGGEGADDLQGGGGTNTVLYEDATSGVAVDLVLPINNSGEAAGDTYSSIQNVIGSDFDDRITGSFGANDLRGGDDDDQIAGRAGDDMLFGQNGDDILEGGAGADVLNGGAGTNTASYSTSAGLTVDLVVTGNNTGDAVGDTFISIQNLEGSAFGDTLWGSFGNNQLDGLGGNDFLRGRAGNDTLQGGDGNDQLDGGAGADVLDGDGGVNTANYLSSGIGLTIDLTNPGNNTGDAAGDTYFSVQNVQGTFQDDTITGDGQDNLLIGSTGNDTLFGLAGDDTLTGQGGDDILVGGAGADTLQGGVGNDIASYQDAGAGVFADLIVTGLNTGDAAGDSYNAIRGLIGSDHADTLRGQFGTNSLDGGDGDDTLLGRGGSDTKTGGLGSDTFVYQNGFGANETITDFDEFDNNEKIDLASVAAIVDFADLVANHMAQNGAHVEITDGVGGMITVQNALVGDMNALDFIF